MDFMLTCTVAFVIKSSSSKFLLVFVGSMESWIRFFCVFLLPFWVPSTTTARNHWPILNRWDNFGNSFVAAVETVADSSCSSSSSESSLSNSSNCFVIMSDILVIGTKPTKLSGRERTKSSLLMAWT
ncbi:hypothetical protein WICPIJ_006254 [Wickerhamomyces pijperi]|uniref:Uncharacterized protein n=1 Tax=Wickerhamomyces pijperi TaxID=599730 RepID=A0A9P8Q4D3_WICPI|nr:hypothetical protein WICPIJ_006254 [Wickerhamomyces pijperi]